MKPEMRWDAMKLGLQQSMQPVTQSLSSSLLFPFSSSLSELLELLDFPDSSDSEEFCKFSTTFLIISTLHKPSHQNCPCPCSSSFRHPIHHCQISFLQKLPRFHKNEENNHFFSHFFVLFGTIIDSRWSHFRGWIKLNPTNHSHLH